MLARFAWSSGVLMSWFCNFRSMEVPMSTARRLIAPVVLLVAASTAAFAGQQHIVAPSELAAAVDARVAAADADRAAVREALARPQVREAAAKFGVDLARAATALDTLEGPDLARAAEAARSVNQQFVGGASSITITTTTLIIVLLVIILLIVAIK
jgi:hypothetical protein